MMTANCAWCNKATIFSADHEKVSDISQHICPNCLISLLPKILIPERELIGKKTPGEERRRHERHPVVTNVYLSSASKNKKSVKILILDISEMGMKIQIDEKLDSDEEITMGIVGEDIIYKAICLVKHVDEAQLEGKTIYKIGTQLIGIHQDLRTI